MLKLSLELIETEQQIANMIRKALADELYVTLNKKNNAANQADLSREIVETIKFSPAYQDLIPGGRYYSEFGVPDIQSKLDIIIESLARMIEIDIVRKGNDIYVTGGITKDHMLRLIDMPEAKYVTESGKTLEWLRWLLFEGDKYIILRYQTIIKPQYSRTDKNIMVQNNKTTGWKVPPELVGTPDDNFITRALEGSGSVIDKYIYSKLFKDFM